MKKNTKIFNTEVIERLALSDNIPPFDEQRNGTQVIMIEDGKKTVIYDDYSMYCDADARKWRVEAYNRTDGRKYDRLCMCGGVYPNKNDWKAERECLDMKGDGIDGCVSAFVYNSITPETSEKGDVFFKVISNTIIRVA